MEKGNSAVSQELEPIQDQEVPDEVEVEVQDSAPEVEAVEEQEQEEPKKRDAKTRINEVTRQKYQAIEQMKSAMDRANALELENEQLRRLNSMQTNASALQQEATAKERLERAKERKALAIESGDIKGQVDADIAIAEAVSEVQKIDYDKTYRQVQQEYDQQNYEAQQRYAEAQMQQYQRPEEANRHIAEKWLMDNEWFMKQSPNFNPKLHDEVQRLCDQLDATLYRSGEQYKIYSDEYFQYVNQQIPALQQRLGTRPAMSKSQNYVEPVRGGNQNYAQKQRVTLTSEQKDLIRGLGVKPEEYIKHMRSDQARRKANYDSQRGAY